ncbi:MAG: VOC family protein [Mycobacteriaceae bacterium]|uniref:VOC family protein n=1 Tax=Corynebacterium sp. TaxID=1720 RepID=UPI003F981A48
MDAPQPVQPVQRIVPHLRIHTGDHGTVGAARFYSDAFRPLQEAGLELGAQGTRGIQDGVEVTIAGFRILLTDAADAAPDAAEVSPATSFTVNVDPVFFGWSADAGDDTKTAAHSRARAALDTVWDALCEQSPATLMELGDYPFSPRYGWVVDQYGVSWQVMLTDPAGEPRPAIIPSLLFCGPAQNRAGETVDAWLRIFGEAFGDATGAADGTRPGERVPYPEQTGPAAPGAVMFSDACLAGTWVVAMDSGVEQPFTFTDAISYEVICDTPVQAEMLRRELGGGPGTDHAGVGWRPRFAG